jgi:glutamine cyclotransferase
MDSSESWRSQASIFSCIVSALLLCLAGTTSGSEVPGGDECSYSVAGSYPHDRGAFTQGLLYSDGKLYESTGRFGFSTLREVELKTGRALRKNRLPDEDFGEGLALVNGQLLQLTWTSGHGYIWNLDNFELVGTMPFLYTSPHESGQHHPWGLCYDQRRLVLSNGTNVLHFLDSRTFRPLGELAVHDANGPLGMLNELECIGDKVLANVWKSETIAIIDAATGRVGARLDFTHLHPPEKRSNPENVLNGIAWDAEHQRLLVTGKHWPRLFEIKLTEACLTP